MKIIIDFDINKNSAFDSDDNTIEINRILKKYIPHDIDKISDKSILDINGNKIGSIIIKD